MRNFTLKATAVAIAALMSGGAYAAANFTLTTADGNGGVVTYAKELNFNGNAGGTAIVGGAPGGGAGGMGTASTPLGFGVSATQNRYVQIKLSTNASFSAAVANGDLQDVTTAFNNVVVVSGGAVGDQCVVFQVTGAAAGHPAADTIEWTTPSVNVTSNMTNVSATYTLHETATSASCSTGNNSTILSAPVTGPIAIMADSFTWDGTDYTETAAVANSYKKFIAVPNDLYGGLTELTVTLGANMKADGMTPVAATDLISGALLTVNGDFSAGDPHLTLSGGNCDNAGWTAGTHPTTLSATQAQWTLTPAQVGALNDQFVCYQANGTAAIAISDYQELLSLTALAGVNISNPPALAKGHVIHDGTTLKVPYVAAGVSGQTARVTLTNTGTSTVGYEATCYGNGLATGTSATGNIPAQSAVVLPLTGLCNAAQLSSKRGSIIFNISAPVGQVIGSYAQWNTTDGSLGVDGMVGNQ